MKRQRVFRLSDAAQSDLVGIFNYIAADDKRAADLVIGRITDKIEWVAYSGFTGSPRGTLFPDLRVTHSGPYGIYFTVGRDAVLVHRIMHDRRNVQPDDFSEH